MSNAKLTNPQLPKKKVEIRKCMVTEEDIDWWIEKSCVAPPVSILKQVKRAVEKVKKRNSKVYIYWDPDGSFRITNYAD